MVRPKHRNRLSIEVGKWYAAEQLIVLGWSGFCCRDGLARLLRDWVKDGVQGMELDTIPADELRKTLKPKNPWQMFSISEQCRFRFKSRKRAKLLRDVLALADAEQRLSDDDTNYRCDCEKEDRY